MKIIKSDLPAEIANLQQVGFFSSNYGESTLFLVNYNRPGSPESPFYLHSAIESNLFGIWIGRHGTRIGPFLSVQEAVNSLKSLISQNQTG